MSKKWFSDKTDNIIYTISVLAVISWWVYNYYHDPATRQLIDGAGDILAWGGLVLFVLLVLCFVLFTLFQVLVVLDFLSISIGLLLGYLALLGLSIAFPWLFILSYLLTWVFWYVARKVT